MPTYYDSQNNAYVLSERIGSGGEGTVFFVDDARETVAKIYHEPITDEKAEKLRWMAANKTERLLKVSAWVVDVLTDAPGGKIVGFLMPSVKAKEIHELYSLKSRRVYFPEATWHFLVHTAANVARAFYNLHNANHIMGDVNHGNCVVLADGTVKLIDCDSYSIKIGEMRYACGVGVATHLAPELQGADLSEVERETKHDNFGLAVIIFQLLFLGRHPFAGKYLGAEDKSIEDCIRELRFAYGDQAQFKNVQPPPGTLPLAAVGARAAEMFERAFLTENRPEAREWIEALEDLSNNLEQCALHPGHLYFNHLAACPWCGIELQTGLMLFPFVTGNQAGDEKPFNIFTIENLIANLGISNNLPAKPLLPEVLPAPSEEAITAREKNRNYTVGALIIQLSVVLILMGFFSNGIALFVGICLLIIWLYFANSEVKYLREDLEDQLAKAQEKWNTLENQWAQKILPPKIENDLSQIKQKIGEYQKFQHSSVQQHKNLLETITRRQLHEHLQTAQIVDAKIYGIREKQIESLLENNFRTAADMDSGRLRYIPTVGKRTIEKLLEWRTEVEKSFVPDIGGINLEHEKTKLAQQTGEDRRRIEIRIEQLFVSLRAGAVDLRRRRQELAKQATEFAVNLAQSKSNVEHLGTNTPVVVGLVLITFLTPYIGFVADQMKFNQSPAPPSYSKNNGSGNGIISAPPIFNDSPAEAVEELDIPDEKITDKQIAALSAARREEYAVNLYTQATEYIYGSQPDFKNAERKMRLAVRLQNNETNYLNQLGYVLYEQEKHKESLEQLGKSLKINSRDTGAMMLIAMNHIKTEDFDSALPHLWKVVQETPNSLDGNYHLGAAYNGLERYDSAITVLEKARDLGRKDADTYYQLAVGYYHNFEQFSAEASYYEVWKLDRAKAAKLRKEIKIASDSEVFRRTRDGEYAVTKENLPVNP